MNAHLPQMLAGLTVLDLSLFVAGPFGSMILADLGAEVIKIEPLEGDPIRDNQMGVQIEGESAQFQSYNRNKRSVCINLKSDAGRELFLKLAKTADVVYDNFRPGVMQRLGLSYDSLRAINPGIISVSISAFGADGPLAKNPGYDLIVQALGGGMSLTGHAQTGPAHIPFHIGDVAGGLYGAISILAAVVERNRTGRGRALDISLLDAQIALLGDEVTNCAASGVAPDQHGAGHPQLVPYRAYMTKDAPLVIAAVGVEKFWIGLTNALGQPELANDTRFSNNKLRVANRADLESVLEAILSKDTCEHWLDRLIECDVPAAPVLNVRDAIAHPQVVHRDAIAKARLAGGTPVAYARTPIRTTGEPAHEVIAAPRRGAHTRAVLIERVGLATKDVDQLIEAGVVRQHTLLPKES
jgi:crotonobetainyl-CoA:carnitine CoA-transferase CaiB-like acyl-CoA transferase